MSPGCAPGDAMAVSVLADLMPMFALLDPGLRVRAAGRTLQKIAGPGLLGRPLAERFEPVLPESLESAAVLLALPVIRLRLRGPVPTALKGMAVPCLLMPGGVLVNLSFSYGLREAVADHGLAATDFAPTDLAFELLYLAEANAAVMAEARKASERLRGARALAWEQALTDPLTGLRNRRGLDRALARLAAGGTPFGLIHADLDHFKHINDSLGHAAGDRVLAGVADRLRRLVRDEDCVARLGGDEFVILLPGLRDRAGIEAVAQRLLADLARPIDTGAGAVPVSASLGVVLWPGTGPVSAEALLLAADRALYRSKDAGRGRLTFGTSPPEAA